MNKEKDDNITTLLGLPQQKLALLLQLSRSQWSLYDLRLRSIPLAARQQVAEFLAMVNSADLVTLSVSRQAEEKEQHQLSLKKLLRKNQHQQENMSRKIAAAEKKYRANLRARHWLPQAVAKENPDPNGEMSLLQLYLNQTHEILEQNGWSQLEQLQIKLRVLQEEEKLLREALRQAQGDN